MRCHNPGCKEKVKTSSAKFCSRSCSASFNNRLKPKRKATAKKKAVCKNCKEQFRYHPGASQGKYCSIPCMADYKKKRTLRRIQKGTNVTDTGLKDYLRKKYGDKCSKCELGPKWNGKPLVLQLDHRDGDSDNNSKRNVRLLCPNCHTQTPTYGNGGQGNRYRKYAKRNIALRRLKGYTE